MYTHKFIIGISGKARSGKDTFANMLHNKIYNSKIVRFAQPIKDMIKAGFNLSTECIEGDLKDKPLCELNGLSPRLLMQTLGTDWGRELDPDIWIYTLMSSIDNIKEDIVIIPDVRFLNEAKFVRNSGMLVHINRDDTPEVNKHVSEEGFKIENEDYVINNIGTMEDFNNMFNLFWNKVHTEICAMGGMPKS